MIRSQNVDGAVAVLQFLIMVGDVHAKIRGSAVTANQNAVFVVAELRRAKEERAVLLVGEAQLAQMLDAFADFTGVMQLALALPAIVLHAEAPRRRLLLRDELVAPDLREVRQPLRFLGGDPALAVDLGNALRDRHEILAGIAVFGEGIRRVEELTIASIYRASERVELSAGIVDDPFNENVITGEPHRTGEGRASRHRAPLHDDEGSRRVRAPKLQRDPVAVVRRLAVSITFPQDLRHDGVPDGRRDAKVDESRDGLDSGERARDIRVAREIGDEIRGDLLRRPACCLRETEREIRCKVTELGAARRFESDFRRGNRVFRRDKLRRGLGEEAQSVVER